MKLETQDGNTAYTPTPRAGPVDELIKLGFSKKTLAALAPAIAVTRLVRYDPGETLFHASTDADALYVIHQGRVKLLNYLESGRARIVRIHNRGSIIGLNGLIDTPHTNTAIAIDKLMVYQIPMHLIRAIKEEDSETYCELLEYWYEYLNMADTWITDFSTGPIRRRAARLLHFLVENDEDTGSCEVNLLTVEEMADILGVTPESISRTMADFKRKGMLNTIDESSPDHYHCNLERLLLEVEK